MHTLKKKAPPRPGSSASDNIRKYSNTARSEHSQADCSIIVSIWRLQPDAKHLCIWAAVKNSKDEDASDKKHHWFTPDRLGEVQACIDQYAATHNVYAAPRGFKRPSRVEGNEADAATIAYADLDGADPRKLSLDLRPHIAIESSPGSFVGVWLCDANVPTELNQRLTYALGADKGGWAANKLLRLIPGTVNHKYAAKPRVELLWDESRTRPPLPVSKLEALPPVKTLRAPAPQPWSRSNGTTAPAGVSRDELIRSIPLRAGTLRYNLARMTPRPLEDRSRVTCRHIRELIELNYTDDQILIMVDPSSFNKWAGDPEGLQADIERLRLKGPRS